MTSPSGSQKRDALMHMANAVAAVDEMLVSTTERYSKLRKLARNLAWAVDAECDSSTEKAHELMDFLKEDS